MDTNKTGTLFQVETINEYHQLLRLPSPEHPLISVLPFESITHTPGEGPYSLVHNFYTIALKKNVAGKMKYGQQPFDFDAGVLHFMAPKQVLTFEATEHPLRHSGWLLLIHPDFFWQTSLAGKINQYKFFSYNITEALHLSGKEEKQIIAVMKNIAREYHSGVDAYSQQVMIAKIELLLAYSERFYGRQFITRKIANHRVLEQLETLLTTYFQDHQLATQGIPSVQYISNNLHISSNYLSRLLKSLTGQSTQQFVHDRLIAIAKEKLSNTSSTINDIAFELGFEHAQSFSKLFKSKTKQTPLQFRQSFN